MTFAARIPTLASGDPYAGSLLATDFTRKFYKAPGFVGSDFSSLPGLTVTRATPAVSYAQTSGGVLVPFAANVARITDQGLLVEEARTNSVIQSNAFDNAAWSKTAGGGGSIPVVTAASGTSPDGTNDAFKVVFAAPVSGDQSFLGATAFVANAGSWAGAFYVKAFAAGDVGKTIIFRHVGTSAYTTVTLSADWQRASGIETSAGGSVTFDIGLRPAVGGSSGTVSVLLYQVDAQAGAFITSPIRTTSASVTRAADVPVIGSLVAPAAYTIIAKNGPRDGFLAATAEYLFSLDDGSNNNIAQMRYRNASSNFTTAVKSGNVSQWSLDAGTELGIAANQAAGLSLSSAGGLAYANGVSLGSVGAISMPVSPSMLHIGCEVAGGSQLNGYLRQLLMYPRAFSNAELIAATT